MCAETVPKCLSEIQPKTLTFVNNLSISEQKKGTRLDAVSLGDEVSSSSFRSSPPGAGHRRGPRMMRFNRFATGTSRIAIATRQQTAVRAIPR